MNRLPQAILFDMDGLLVDTETVHLQAFAEVATEYGVASRPEDFIPWIGHPSGPTARWIAERSPGGPALAGEILERQRVVYLRILERDRPAPLPGAGEMIAVCGQLGLARALVSSTRYSMLASTMAVVLRHLGLPEEVERTFPVVTSGDRVARLKPAPDPYLQAAAGLGLPARACLALEDSPAGVASAREAGCFVVAIPSPYLDPAPIRAQAHASFATLAEAYAARVWERFGEMG